MYLYIADDSSDKSSRLELEFSLWAGQYSSTGPVPVSKSLSGRIGAMTKILLQLQPREVHLLQDRPHWERILSEQKVIFLLLCRISQSQKKT